MLAQELGPGSMEAVASATDRLLLAGCPPEAAATSRSQVAVADLARPCQLAVAQMPHLQLVMAHATDQTEAEHPWRPSVHLLD